MCCISLCRVQVHGLHYPDVLSYPHVPHQTIYDLLNPANTTDCDIRTNQDGNNYIKGITMMEIQNAKQVEEAIGKECCHGMSRNHVNNAYTMMLIQLRRGYWALNVTNHTSRFSPQMFCIDHVQCMLNPYVNNRLPIYMIVPHVHIVLLRYISKQHISVLGIHSIPR